jgi:hypothetical protein
MAMYRGTRCGVCKETAETKRDGKTISRAKEEEKVCEEGNGRLFEERDNRTD